jgi:hypothetical protein
MQANSAIAGAPGGGSRLRRHIPATIACAFALTALLGCTPRSALQFSPATLPDAQLGSPYAVTVTVSETATPVGGASVSDGALPVGLDLELSQSHDNTIRISGTPTAAGTFTFTLFVWCYGTNVSGQTGTQEYTLTVK